MNLKFSYKENLTRRIMFHLLISTNYKLFYTQPKKKAFTMKNKREPTLITNQANTKINHNTNIILQPNYDSAIRIKKKNKTS